MMLEGVVVVVADECTQEEGRYDSCVYSRASCLRMYLCARAAYCSIMGNGPNQVGVLGKRAKVEDRLGMGKLKVRVQYYAAVRPFA